ncbi:hypothetical protein R1sor_006703 [Riccia sorocarpa]|uniref:Replitron HUH endonuclease domain-containing protein n=1 Tax=Riccia sorocarpa TaxID=122646 RepID=A0ABD3HR70_9MARC
MHSKQAAAFVKIDLSNAYDRLNMRYLWLVLERTGCGRAFTKLVQGLMLGATASIYAEGYISQPIRLDSGAFTVAKGLLDLFCKGTNNKINADKSQVMPIGARADLPDWVMGMEWQVLNRQQVIKYLGYPFSPEAPKVQVWTQVMNTLQRRLHSWDDKTLSFEGRVILLQVILTTIPHPKAKEGLESESRASRQPRLKQQAQMKARMKVMVIKDTLVKDASAARAVKIPKAAAPKRKTEPKEFNISLTLGIAGVDVPGEIFDKLQTYLEEKATMAIMAFERGDAHLLLHIQSMFTIRTTSTRKLKEDIRAAVGWKDTAPLGNSLCVQSLKEKELHTTTGLIGYCLKDEREPHFRMYTKNITERKMEEGRRVHFIYGVSEYKNKVQLTPANVLLRALQYRRYRTKSPISVSFRNCFKQMIRSGQYMPGLKWATMKPMSQLRVERIWQGCVAPETITITDIGYILFGSSHNDQYFSSSHRMELHIAEARKRKEHKTTKKCPSTFLWSDLPPDFMS